MKQTDKHTDPQETIMNASLRQDHPQNHTRQEDAAPEASWTPGRVLLAIGTAGPLLFLAVATILGLLNPNYDAMTEPVSALAWGPNGWVQTANFYAFGAATIAAGIGLCLSFAGRGRLAVAILLSISGTALLIAGTFEGTPPGAEPTISGLLHGMAFFWTFIPLPTAYALSALRLYEERGWRAHALYSAAMPSVVFCLLVVYGVLGSDPGDPLFPVGGILNRVLLVAAFGWVTFTAGRLLSNRSEPQSQPQVRTEEHYSL